MSSIKKGSTRRSDDTMDDDSDDKDSKRKSRNLSEKKRRDQFNLLVNELSSMVSTGGRKMDKSTVLKSTISFLKNHNEIAVRSRINEIQEDWKPTFLTNEEFTHLVLEAVDGFIMVFSSSGHIYYASESIASLLGHLPSAVLSMTIYDLASEDEQTNLYNLLLSPSEEEKQIVFSCHLRRGGPDAKSPPTYELVNFVGYFRSDEDMVQSDNRYSGYSGEADTRLVFVGTGKVVTPQLIKEMPLVDSIKSEFTSRHSLEWKFLFLDHRAPPIIGYLPFELLGTSGYDYYHVDDLSKVVSCHEALMQKGEGTSCYYRFLTKGQQWIWLQTRFYITYHQWNSKPEFIVCTHRVVSYADVMKQSRKDESDAMENPETSPSIGGNSAALPWPSKDGGKSIVRLGPASDCTSVSADSPAVRSTQRLRSNPIVNQQLSPSSQLQPHVQQLQPLQISLPQPQQISPQFLEPPQYLQAIPVQQMIANFPSPTVLSPLQPVDNIVLSPAQNQLQVDLQRKHAELQAIIGQQQLELRRVSEQLLMARLGLLPGSQPQPVVANISINSWKITHGPHVMPKQKICLLEDVIQDKFLQEEIKNIFGGNVFDYIMDLGNKKRKLENLPTALFLNILKYLRANDVLKLMQTNKIFFELCNTELVWLMMFQKILNRSPSIEEKRMALEYGWREVLKKRMAYIRKVFNENKQQKKKQLADPTRNKKVVKAK